MRVGVKCCVCAYDRQFFNKSWRDKHSIERITMMKRQRWKGGKVLGANRQFVNAVDFKLSRYEQPVGFWESKFADIH